MGVRHNVDTNFFPVWRATMAYVLGYLYADGSLEFAPYIRAKYMRVTSTDLDRIEVIRSALHSAHTIVKIRKGGNYKDKYLLRIGSHRIFDQLTALGMTPNKSKTMEFPDVPQRFLADFVRGYFDGDGCAYLEMRKNGRPKRLLCVFTSGSVKFLQVLHDKLQKQIGLVGQGLYEHGSTEGAYQLRYSSADSIRLFKFMYQPPVNEDLFLRRKYAIFTRYFELHADVTHPRLKTSGLVAKK